jgi:arginine/lysine/ornithine decarboxylase
MTRSTAAALMMAALLGVVGAVAPTARADPNDDRFIAALQSQGVTFQSPEAAIVAAHEVCKRLDQGESENQVAQDVINETDLDPYHAGYFVGASVGAYCPQFSAQG